MKNSTTSFSASQIKVARARHFLVEIERDIVAFLSEPGTISFTLTAPEAGVVNISLDIKNPSITLAAAVGDAAHNLRSALDLMATDLARISNSNPHNVYFPFAESKDRLEEMIKKRNFHRCGADAVALLRTLAPFKGGNVALRGLHDLDIQDKHIELVLSRQQIDAQLVVERDGIGSPWRLKVPEVKNIKVVFPPTSPLPGEEVIPTLKNLIETVQGILEDFSRLTAARCI